MANEYEQLHVRAGDQLQSAASRLSEWVREQVAQERPQVPYEVFMAALEADQAVSDWTEYRKCHV